MTAAVGWLLPATLTPSGRPNLLPGEIERYLLPSADLIPDDPTLPSILSSQLSLTTHRLIFLLPSSSASLPLSSVTLISPPKKSLRAMFHSPRVRMEVGRTGGVTVVVRGKGDVDVFYGRLVEVWEGKAWEVREKEREVEEARAVSRPAGVGVSGILRKEQEMWESTDRSLRDAFQDLDALMSKAKEMVMLAEKMRLKLLSGSTSQGSTTSDEDMGSKQEIQDWLLSVGIASPVTKDSAGALYHQELSRQLADFVRVPLERAGGMVSLVDVYCHFNRARGTALISPEDLLQACVLWEKFDVHVMLRRFDSGVMVIQSKDHSDEEVFARINSLVQKPDALLKGISPSDAAMTLGITPALAKEHLLAAENKGLLCRDISPEGFRFYANLFKDIDLSNMYMVKDYTLFHSWVSATSVSG